MKKRHGGSTNVRVVNTPEKAKLHDEAVKASHTEWKPDYKTKKAFSKASGLDSFNRAAKNPAEVFKGLQKSKGEGSKYLRQPKKLEDIKQSKKDRLKPRPSPNPKKK